MARLEVRALAKRLEAIEAKHNPPRVAWIIIGQGEDQELALAKWRAEHPGEDPNFIIWRILISGIPGVTDAMPDHAMPDPALCTRESVLAEIPAVKAHLQRWAKDAPSEALKRVASHWAMLCEKFGIEETP